MSILLLNLMHPAFKLHRDLIIGNQQQSVHLLNVGYVNIYLQTQLLSKHVIVNKSSLKC